MSDLANHTLQYSGGESADKNFAVILDEKNKEIDRQSNIIKTLQQKLATVQKERDVLKTALKKSLSESHANNETPKINHFEEVTANDSSKDDNCSVIVPNIKIVNNQQSASASQRDNCNINDVGIVEAPLTNQPTFNSFKKK